MAFNIEFDYRFDSSNFFTDDRRDALEAAGQLWEDLIQDEFPDVPAGVQFSVKDPSDRSVEQTVTLQQPIDDVRIFVGADPAIAPASGRAGWDGGDASGTVFRVRIDDDFRGTGPVSDYQPWTGSMSFNPNIDWSFDLDGPVENRSDFISTAAHEIGHVLGFGTSPIFDTFIDDSSDPLVFDGPNARAANNGDPVPLADDRSHVLDGFNMNSVLLDPSSTVGERKVPTAIDQGILADIGYEFDGFTAQGETPPIVTENGETVFGTIVADTLDGLGGDDQLQGNAGDDRLFGGAGGDLLFGQDGDDVLEGGPGEDFLDGGFGNDVFLLGDGDTVESSDAAADASPADGAGADLFVVEPGSGTSTIQTFTPGQDRLFVHPDFGFADGAEVAANASRFLGGSRFELDADTTIRIFHGDAPSEVPGADDIAIAAYDADSGNSPPTARDDADGNRVLAGEALTLDVLANDDDADGDTLTLTAVGTPGHGTASITNDDRVAYEADPDFSGTDSFIYTVSDERGATATATVEITVESPAPENSPPVPDDDTAETPSGVALVVDVLANDSDPDDDPLSLDSVTDPANGSAQVTSGEEVRYTPDPGFIGNDSFDYTIQDGQGGAASATVRVTVEPLVLTGTADADRLEGSAAGDRIEGLDGDDVLRGEAGDDTLLGGDGNDTLDGGDGNDTIRGGATEADRRDVIFAGAGDDDVDGGHGNDQLNGGSGNDRLAGGFGVDEVRGNAGDDVMTGSAFSDLIFGGPGFDFVNGGFGFDRVNGGDDADRFFHTGDAGHGSDWIQDYDAGEGDVLLYGGGLQSAQFRVITTETANAGQVGVEEAFVVQSQTGQILWALVDGAAQSEINLSVGGQDIDLFA